MAEREPMTQIINVTEARQKWSQLLNQVFHSKTRVVVEKSGIPVAAIISAKDLERFNRLEAQRTARFKVLDDIGAAFKDVPPDEIEREVANAMADVREESHHQAKPR